MANKYFKSFKNPYINIIRVKKDLEKNFLDFKIDNNYKEISIICNLTPTDLSKTYKVKINFDGKTRPKVYVLEPELKSLINKTYEVHMFRDYSLCLYYKKNYEFNADKDVFSNTIVPWTSLWLYYFELWQYTGKWLGGGIHPI
ncbi:MAG: hypothetical protein JEZ05_00760 [Tenericutes bacterium]|nr:hypothetical protein [Mycoplasmatota bacterium]